MSKDVLHMVPLPNSHKRPIERWVNNSREQGTFMYCPSAVGWLTLMLDIPSRVESVRDLYMREASVKSGCFVLMYESSIAIRFCTFKKKCNPYGTDGGRDDCIVVAVILVKVFWVDDPRHNTITTQSSHSSIHQWNTVPILTISLVSGSRLLNSAVTTSTILSCS